MITKSEVTTKLGKMIRLARKEAGLTQKELAKSMDISPSLLAYFEMGKRRIHPGALMNISQITKKPISYFYEESFSAKEGQHDMSKFSDQLKNANSLLDEVEREKVEVAMQKDLFFEAYTNTAFGIHITDLDGKILFCNTSFCKMYGYEARELVGKHIMMLNREDKEVQDERMEILENKKLWYGVSERVKKDGSLFRVNVSLSLFHKDNSRKDIGIIGISRDVSEDEKTREKLELYQSIVESSFGGVLVIDPRSGKILETNEVTAKALGYSKKELLNLTIMDIEERIPTCEAFLKEVPYLREHGFCNCSGSLRRKDGSIFSVEIMRWKWLPCQDKNFAIALFPDIEGSSRRTTQSAKRKE